MGWPLPPGRKPLPGAGLLQSFHRDVFPWDRWRFAAWGLNPYPFSAKTFFNSAMLSRCPVSLAVTLPRMG
jgi:hypothetical protein